MSPLCGITLQSVTSMPLIHEIHLSSECMVCIINDDDDDSWLVQNVITFVTVTSFALRTRCSCANASRRGVLRWSDDEHWSHLAACRHRVRPSGDERRRRIRPGHRTIHGTGQWYLPVQRHHCSPGQTESTSAETLLRNYWTM